MAEPLQKAFSLEPDSFPGLSSAVRLAIIHFLQDDLPGANRMMEFAKPILKKTRSDFIPAQAYYRLMQLIVAHFR